MPDQLYKMLRYLEEGVMKFDWIGGPPAGTKKVALLVPQYNESGKNFHQRLDYFNRIAKEFEEELDVIIIDDGSTDNSLETIKKYAISSGSSFFIASINPNANKVGALFRTTLSISHELIILSDFDTDIIGIGELLSNSTPLEEDSALMGCYFKMLPFEGSGNVFLFQQLEYSLQRSLYKFHEKERSIRVMPGAGSCYKRQVLTSIYHHHSGLRSGEDREATLIGLKLGYKTFYMDNILALTRPPLSFKALLKQRIRWNLGYLETFHKENEYYRAQIIKFSRVGIITLTDIFIVSFIVLLPFILLSLAIRNIFYLQIFLLAVYIFYICWCFYLLFVSPNESTEFKAKRLHSILLFPVFKIFVDYFSWMGALFRFFFRRRRL